MLISSTFIDLYDLVKLVEGFKYAQEVALIVVGTAQAGAVTTVIATQDVKLNI